MILSEETRHKTVHTLGTILPETGQTQVRLIYVYSTKLITYEAWLLLRLPLTGDNDTARSQSHV